jgi:putative redox protein
LGGNDLGPNPYELLSAGLAACTAITVKMYAQRKKWPLEDVHVTIEHTKIVAPEEYKEAAQNRKIDYFKRLIRIEGAELDADQRARLLDIADKCPVHRTLHMPVVSSAEEVI